MVSFVFFLLCIDDQGSLSRPDLVGVALHLASKTTV
jgi:hypothetical protein